MFRSRITARRLRSSLPAAGLLLLPAVLSAQDVPAPADVLGYELGDRFTDVAGVERYFTALSEASELVTLDRYGWTVEGRPLLQAVVTSPGHHERMEEILELNRELTDPETSEERAREIASVNPAIVYFTYGIHGDEAASPEAAMWTAWELASGHPELAGVLDSLVVVIDPAANPDGRDRYVNFQRSATQARSSPELELRERRQPWPGGRFNHYLFDLNRDWAWLTQSETRDRLVRYRLYEPQVHVDFHEMGYASNYFFFPPADPINPIYPDHVLAWGERFGAANARAMDREGLLYFTREVFDLFYPGYGDSWPALQGAVGMTYEQAGGGFASQAVRLPDGTLLTLRDRAFGHRVTGNATLRAAAQGKTELLLGFAGLHREIDDGLADVYLVPGDDPGPLTALADLLRLSGIRVERAAEEIRLDAIPHPGFMMRDVFPDGTLRVPARQARGRLAGALLRPDNLLDGPGSYDITAWALPYAFGVEAHSDASGGGGGAGSWAPLEEGGLAPGAPAGEVGGYGYLVRPSFSHWPALVRFLEAEGRAWVLPEPFSLEGGDYPAGTIFLPRGRIAGLDERLDAAGLRPFATAVSTGRATSGPDLGTAEAAALELPRLALLGGEGTSPTGMGAHWHFLEQVLDVPFDIVNVSDVTRVELDRYQVLLVPSAATSGGGAGSLLDVLGEEGVERIGGWVRAGGTLVAVAEAAGQLAGPVAEVEERVHEEDPDAEDRVSRALRSREERELERWEERTPGTILQPVLDPAHPLSFGAAAGGSPGRVFVLSAGRAFEPDPGYESVVHFPEGLDRISGVISERNLHRLGQSAWLVDRSLGSGRVILFADDPAFRGFWHSGFQLLANALFIAPAF